MCSRYAYDARGRLIVEITSVTCAALPVGARFRVLGNSLPVNEVGFGWLGRTGRPPTPRERLEARPPYDSTGRWRKPKPVVVDDELDEAAQLADVWAAQIREPADLIGAALPA